jgi:hypothetical protein
MVILEVMLDELPRVAFMKKSIFFSYELGLVTEFR